MPRVRANASARWVRRAGSAQQEYEEGVRSPRADWATATVASAPVHTTATQQALADGRFAKGVQAAGSSRWQSKALSKGAPRFGPGVADAESDYQKGVQPYLDVLNNVTLPPRGPKGDPKNIQRVIAVVTALRNKKLGK